MQLLSSEVILDVESEFALIVLTLTSQTITVDFLEFIFSITVEVEKLPNI